MGSCTLTTVWVASLSSMLTLTANSTMTLCLAPLTPTTSWTWILVILFRVLSSACSLLAGGVPVLQASIQCGSVLHRGHQRSDLTPTTHVQSQTGCALTDLPLN